MSVHVWDIAAGKSKANALHAIDCLLSFRYLLPKCCNMREEFSREVVEVGMVCSGHDLRMSRPDRSDIEEGNNSCVLVDDMGRYLPSGDRAKEARAHFLWIERKALIAKPGRK